MPLQGAGFSGMMGKGAFCPATLIAQPWRQASHGPSSDPRRKLSGSFCYGAGRLLASRRRIFHTNGFGTSTAFCCPPQTLTMLNLPRISSWPERGNNRPCKSHQRPSLRPRAELPASHLPPAVAAAAAAPARRQRRLPLGWRRKARLPSERSLLFHLRQSPSGERERPTRRTRRPRVSRPMTRPPNAVGRAGPSEVSGLRSQVFKHVNIYLFTRIAACNASQVSSH